MYAPFAVEAWGWTNACLVAAALSIALGIGPALIASSWRRRVAIDAESGVPASVWQWRYLVLFVAATIQFSLFAGIVVAAGGFRIDELFHGGAPIGATLVPATFTDPTGLSYDDIIGAIGAVIGGVVGAVVTAGIIVGSSVPMFLGAMIVGPVGGFLIKKFDDVFEERIPSSLSTRTPTGGWPSRSTRWCSSCSSAGAHSSTDSLRRSRSSSRSRGARERSTGRGSSPRSTPGKTPVRRPRPSRAVCSRPSARQPRSSPAARCSR